MHARRSSSLPAASLALALFLPAVVRAGTTPPNTPEQVEVRGLSPEAERHEIEILLHPPRNQQLARWSGALCPAVVGLQEPFRTLVINRLEQWYKTVAPGAPARCTAENAFLFFTDRSDALFSAILNRDPQLGRGFDSSGLDADDVRPPGKAELASLEQPRPIRWYRAVSTDPSDGTTIENAPVLPDHRTVRVVTTTDGSLLGSTTVVRTTMVVVIVDLPRAAGANWRQLADYVSFAVLGDPQLGASFGQSSIMSLFDNDKAQADAPSGMTAFDQSVLRALYAADPAQPATSEQQQVSQDVRRAARR